jgi:hypothetical protein
MASLLLVPLLLLSGCQAKFEKMLDANVDQAEKSRAQDFAQKVYQACRTNHFEPLGDEATAEMRTDLSPAKQKQTCGYIQLTFGDYQSMDFVETWTGGRSAHIYRFKGHFSKATGVQEIRVVLDKTGKVSGFWLKPWLDTLG